MSSLNFSCLARKCLKYLSRKLGVPNWSFLCLQAEMYWGCIFAFLYLFVDMSWGDPTCSFLYYLYCTHVQLLKVRLLWLFGAIEAGSCRACFSFEQPDGMLHQNTFNHQKSRDILPRKIALEDTLSRWLDPTVLTVSYQSFLIHELIELPQPLDTSSWNPSTFPSTKDPRTHGWCSKTVVKRLVIWDGQFGELMQVRSSEMYSICRCLQKES